MQLLLVCVIQVAFFSGAFVAEQIEAAETAASGMSYEGEFHAVENYRFLYDSTYLDKHGQRVIEHEIFDQVYALIKQSTRFVLVDMFLFNDFKGKQTSSPRPLAEELTKALLQKKESSPDCEIILITDPINTVYGAKPSPYLERLKSAGIRVVITDLEKLPDSNTLYSALWRTLFSSGQYVPAVMLPNPFDSGEVPLASMLSLLNFKANHRKVVIGVNDDEMSAIVSSANPHDGSGAHENLAVQFSGKAVEDLLATERTVLHLSGKEDIQFHRDSELIPENGQTTIRVITENAIKHAVLSAIDRSESGDLIDIAMFYFSERDIIKALGQAQARGVVIRLLLDPNKDAFGREKNGIPNRQVAHELALQGASIRWCLTQGEQCHSKMLLARYKDGTSRVILGSANFTRRNIGGFNLETDVELRSSTEHPSIKGLIDYFEHRWLSTSDRNTSVAYSTFSDSGQFKYWQYRLMESSGLSTF